MLRPAGRFAVVKDGGVSALRDFSTDAAAAGFSVVRQEDIEGEGVCFTLWVCS